MDGLSIKLKVDLSQVYFHGLNVSHSIHVSHIFFVNDALTFSLVSWEQWLAFYHIMIRFGDASGLFMNGNKSILIFTFEDHDVI